jgi:hypothetical protein
MLFRRKKPQVTRHESLSAKPVQLVEPDIERTDDQGAKLKVQVRPAKWASFLMGKDRMLSKTFELDSLGMFVWESCDGKTTVQQIIRKLAKRHNLTQREAEVGTIQFLQMLVKKSLVGMVVPDKKDAPRR